MKGSDAKQKLLEVATLVQILIDQCENGALPANQLQHRYRTGFRDALELVRDKIKEPVRRAAPTPSIANREDLFDAAGERIIKP